MTGISFLFLAAKYRVTLLRLRYLEEYATKNVVSIEKAQHQNNNLG